MLRSVEELDQLEKTVRQTTETLVYRNRISVSDSQQHLYCALARTSGDREDRNKYFEYEHMQSNAYLSLMERWRGDKVKLHILNDGWGKFHHMKRVFNKLLNEPPPTNMSEMLGAPVAFITYRLTQQLKRGSLNLLFNQIEQSQMKSLIESQEKEAEIKRSILFALLASIIVSLSAGLIFSRSIAGKT